MDSFFEFMDYSEQIRLIRKSFFAYRNGIIADSLRRCNDPHKSIMGCQWVDIKAIAEQVPQNAVLAEKLWEIRDSRECRMVAPLLYPLDEFDVATAIMWGKAVECDEIADVFCQALAGRMNDVLPVVEALAAEGNDQCDYTAFRLLQNAHKRGTVVLDGNVRRLIDAKKSTVSQHVRPILLDLLSDCQQ